MLVMFILLSILKFSDLLSVLSVMSKDYRQEIERLLLGVDVLAVGMIHQEWRG